MFSCLLFMGVLPVNSFAAGEALLVNGADITRAPDYTVVCGEGTAVYDPGSKTLTLENATLSQQIDSDMHEELTIQLVGANTIDTSSVEDETTANAIDTLGTLKILSSENANGSLKVISKKNGLVCEGLNTDRVSLDLEYKGSDMYGQAIVIGDSSNAPESSEIKNSDIIIRGYTFGSIVLSGVEKSRTMTIENSKIDVQGDGAGIIADILKILDSEIMVEDTQKAADPEDDLELLYGTKALIIEDSRVTAKGQGSYPALCTEKGGNITIHNSSVSAANPDSNAIWSNGGLVISGNSKVTAESLFPAVASQSGLTIKDTAEVKAVSSDDIAIFSKGVIHLEGTPVIQANSGRGFPAIVSFYTGDESGLQCSPNLIPPGYKVGTTQDGTKTTFIPVDSEWLKDDYSNGIGDFTGIFIKEPVLSVDLDEAEVIYTKGQAARELKVTAEVSDGGMLSYQWYVKSKNSAPNGTAIDGAVGASYVPVTDTVGTNYYYCVVTNTNSQVTGDKTISVASKTATITVKEETGGTDSKDENDQKGDTGKQENVDGKKTDGTVTKPGNMPKTGDENNGVLYAVLMLVSVVGIGTLVYKKKAR